jgi:hypothetical protein
MRFSAMVFALLALTGGYIVSVPLFGHYSGTLPDGQTTQILTQKDAAACEARLARTSKSKPPVPSEPEELPPLESSIAAPRCQFTPVSSVSWDWLYLRRTLPGSSPDSRESPFLLDSVTRLFTSKSTFEIATGAGLVAGLLLLLRALFTLCSGRVFRHHQVRLHAPDA